MREEYIPRLTVQDIVFWLDGYAYLNQLDWGADDTIHGGAYVCDSTLELSKFYLFVACRTL